MADKPKTSRNPKGIRRDEQFQRDKKKNESKEYIWVKNRRGNKVRKKNPAYKPPTTSNKEKAKVKTKSEGGGDGGYYKIPGLKQPDFSKKNKKDKKGPSERDKRIGKELAAQFKKDDAEIAAARKTAAEREAAAEKKKKSKPKKSNVFTRHYKTGKPLGVMTRSQRRKYDAEAHAAGGKSFDERVKATGDKSNKRETNYIASQRKKKPKKKDDLKVKK